MASSDFMISFAGDSLSGWREYIQTADASGFWGLGIADSQSIYPDAYVCCTIAAMTTRNMRLGPWVTNPLTRHPAVTACAIASVDQVSEGRTFLGIGTGHSATANVSLRPASLACLESYLGAVKDLLAHGEAQWEGQALKLAVGQRRVPVYVAATGPKTVRMAGRLADGVVIGMGISPEIVQDALTQLRQGAQEAGRGLEDVDVWWSVMSNLAEDDETALNEIKNSLVTRANSAFRISTPSNHLPPEYEPAIKRIHAEYNAMEHAKFGPSYHARLCDELGLTSYLAQRFAICGSPQQFISRIEAAYAAGARKLCMHVRVADKRRFFHLWNTKVRPRFAQPLIR